MFVWDREIYLYLSSDEKDLGGVVGRLIKEMEEWRKLMERGFEEVSMWGL